MQKFCPDGETGRRNRLKICCPKGRAGSTPAPGTIFLYAGRSRFAGARLAVVAARVEYASTLPSRLLGKTRPAVRYRPSVACLEFCACRCAESATGER